jgi:hypothetical protein
MGEKARISWVLREKRPSWQFADAAGLGAIRRGLGSRIGLLPKLYPSKCAPAGRFAIVPSARSLRPVASLRASFRNAREVPLPPQLRCRNELHQRGAHRADHIRARPQSLDRVGMDALPRTTLGFSR